MENTELTINKPSGNFRIRPIAPADSDAMRDIILETLIEHGAVGSGFASSDWDTRHMWEAFQKEGRRYFVLEWEGTKALQEWEGTKALQEWEGTKALPYGGAGFAPLPGEAGTCELVKMYFRPEVRGLGLGKELLQLCLDEAAKMGYQQIYLETIEQMRAARGLYERMGFKQIPGQMGNTGHFSCDVFYLRKLG